MEDKKLSVVFCGPGGAGKTTLCKEWSEYYNSPYKAIQTKNIMPDGVNSHLDVLTMAVTEPQMGIKFQTDLVEQRLELFKSLNEESFTSDRAVIDSYIYYAMHNSMFSNPGHDDYLNNLTLESLNYYDITVVVAPNLEGTTDNGVRIFNKSYYDVVSGAIRAYINKDILIPYYVDQYIIRSEDENLKATATVLKNGHVILYLIEDRGFSEKGSRLEVIKEVVNMYHSNITSINSNYKLNNHVKH